jgi:release factor glutamine methyltransferase
MPLEIVYQPREDSFLLAREVMRHARGRVLDMGTGSGIQAVTAAQSPKVRAVGMADISKRAIDYCESHLRHKKIKWLFHSDLFADVPGLYDTIIFNAPYLPWEPGLPRTIVGGKKGWETAERFLKQAKEHLAPKGQILLLFSSATNKQMVDRAVLREGYAAEPLAEERLNGFETLYVYRLCRPQQLEQLARKGMGDFEFLAQGRRGVVYTAQWKGGKVAIKLKRPGSTAMCRPENEAKMLQRVNKLGIGPKFRGAGPGYVIYEFVPGTPFIDWFRTAPKNKAVDGLRQFLEQAYALDRAGISKEEMLRPLKNALVHKGTVTLIDFERAHPAKDPKNVTQACQFIVMSRKTLRRKRIAIDLKQLILLARTYKWKPDRKSFDAILALLPREDR